MFWRKMFGRLLRRAFPEKYLLFSKEEMQAMIDADPDGKPWYNVDVTRENGSNTIIGVRARSAGEAKAIVSQMEPTTKIHHAHLESFQGRA